MPVILLGLMVIAVHAIDSQSSPGAGSDSLTSNASSGAFEAHNVNEAGQNENLVEDKPVIILSPEKGTSEDLYNYTIYPPLSFKPPQIIMLTWLSPPGPLTAINSSGYRGLDKISQNAKYWTAYEPIVISMRIPDDYQQRFVGQIRGNLTIGSKLYTVPGPYIESYTRENLMQLGNGSWSYNFDILSDETYQICPSCNYGEGQEQKGEMACRNNTPGKEDLLRWLIPKEKGVPNKCSSSMVPWA